MTEIEFEADGRRSKWWGYGDFYCDVSSVGPRILLPYQGEPAHGDSYHKLIIDSKTIRGYVWSGYFLWSKCGRFFTWDWLEGMGGHRQGATWVFTQVLRATIIVEPRELRYRVVLAPSRDEVHKILLEDGEDTLWEVLLSAKDDDWKAFDLVSESAPSEISGLSSSSPTGKATMLKTAVFLVLKRNWRLVAVIVGMNAASQWRHAHYVSVSGLLLTLLAALLARFLTAVPVQFHKLRAKR
jgi:hypothetical protein